MHREPARSVNGNVDSLSIGQLNNFLGAVSELVASIADALGSGCVAASVAVTLVHGFATVADN